MSLKRKEITVVNVAALSSISVGDGDTINILGYYTPGDGGGQLVRYSASASDTVDGGFVFDGPGSLGRFVAIDQTVANVRKFGALGDGASNDTAFVQAAIDAKEATGGEVYFPPGDYIATVVMDQDSVGIKFTGDGRDSVLEAVNANEFALTLEASFPRVLIQDLTFEGNSKTKHGIYVNTGAGVRFERARVQGCGIGTAVNASIGLKWSQCSYRTSYCGIYFTTRDTGNLDITDVSGQTVTLSQHTFEQHSGFQHLVGCSFDVCDIGIYQDQPDNSFDPDSAIVMTQGLFQNGTIGVWMKESGRPGSHPVKLDNTWMELDNTVTTVAFNGDTKANADFIVESGRLEGDNVRVSKLELTGFGVAEFRNSKIGDSFEYTKDDSAQLRFDRVWIDNGFMPVQSDSFRLFTTTQGRPSSSLLPDRTNFETLDARNRGDIDEITYAASLAVDFSSDDYNRKGIELTGALTITSFAASEPGFYELRLLQDGTGGHAVTLPTLATGSPTVDTTADELTIIDLFYDGVDWHNQRNPKKLLYSVMGVTPGDDGRIANFTATKSYNASAVTPIGTGAIRVDANASYSGPRIRYPSFSENSIGVMTMYARSDESTNFRSIGAMGTWDVDLTPDWRCYAAMTVAVNPTDDFTDFINLQAENNESFEVCGIQVLEFESMAEAVDFLESKQLLNGEGVNLAADTTDPRRLLVESVADLAGLDPADGDTVQVMGYYAAHDGGGNLYRYDVDGSGTIDGGFIIDGPGSVGRYIAVDQTIANVKQFGATGDGVTDDTAFIQSAIDSSDQIYVPGGTYLIDTLNLTAGDTLFGNGAGESILRWRDPASDGNMLSFPAIPDVTVRDIELDGQCVPADYNVVGAIGIQAGTGTGGSSASANVVISNVYLHDMSKQAIVNFAGGDNWLIENCRIERCGRAGVVHSGLRQSRIIGNYIEDTGDDGIAVNNNSTSTTVTGNVLVRCGSLIDITAAGLKIHGHNISVVGNTFRECYNSISVKAHATFGETHEIASYASAQNITITGNTIHHTADISGTTSPAAVEIQSAYGVLVNDNTIIATQADGTPRDIFSIEQGGALEVRNNLLVGGSIRFASEFFRDAVFKDNRIHIYQPGSDQYHDFYVLEFVSAAKVEKVQFIDNGIDEASAITAKGFGNVNIGELEIAGNYEIANRPIAFLDENVLVASGARTSIALKNEIDDQTGSSFRLEIDDEMYICTIDSSGVVVREPLILTAVVDSQSTSLSISGWTPSRDYVETDSWLAAKRPSTISNPTRKGHWFGSGSDNVVEILNIGNNQIDISGNQYGGSTINEFRFLRGSAAIRPTGLLSRQTYEYFDTDLGQPIFWTGTGWVDATGAGV